MTTGENSAKGAENMPGITFEIDPDVAKGSNYSSLVFMPANSPANQWSGYIDATTTGKWGLTSGKFDANASCNISGPRCTLAQVMGVLGGDAKIMTVAVAKGRTRLAGRRRRPAHQRHGLRLRGDRRLRARRGVTDHPARITAVLSISRSRRWSGVTV